MSLLPGHQDNHGQTLKRVGGRGACLRADSQESVIRTHQGSGTLHEHEEPASLSRQLQNAESPVTKHRIKINDPRQADQWL